MEIKNNQLTIDIPEGMEIDTENSSLAEGIIKFKSKYITYSKIFNSFNSVINTNVYTHSNDTKKDINWNALTESQCKALRFGSWQSEEDVEEEISCLQSALDKGRLTKEEFDKKVFKEKNTLGLRLIPLYLYPSLPIGITLTSIGGEEIVFDGSNIDTDVRFGCIAWGIKPKKD